MTSSIILLGQTQSTDRVWQKIRLTVDYWAAIEKNAAQQKHRETQLDKDVVEAEIQKLYLQKQLDDKI